MFAPEAVGGQKEVPSATEVEAAALTEKCDVIFQSVLQSIARSHLAESPNDDVATDEELFHCRDCLAFRTDAIRLALHYLGFFAERTRDASLTSRTSDHETFLRKYQSSVPEVLLGLWSSRPWLCYWSCQGILSLNNLRGTPKSQDEIFDKDLKMKLQRTLLECQDTESTAFGGGPSQLPNILSTYAAISAVSCVHGDREVEASLLNINKERFVSFLRDMRDPETGGFRVHRGGEIDVRAAYCAVSVAQTLGLDIFDVEHSVEPHNSVFYELDSYITGLQTAEGGLAGEPGLEAHGGYTFCGLAALFILTRRDPSSFKVALDLDRMLLWAVRLQDSATGGFAGRTNKLSDSCYSYWVGGTVNMLQAWFVSNEITPEGSATKRELVLEEAGLLNERRLFNYCALKSFLFYCCMNSGARGGIKDKPGTAPDLVGDCPRKWFWREIGLLLARQRGIKSIDVTAEPRGEMGRVDGSFHPKAALETIKRAQNFHNCDV